MVYTELYFLCRGQIYSQHYRCCGLQTFTFNVRHSNNPHKQYVHRGCWVNLPRRAFPSAFASGPQCKSWQQQNFRFILPLHSTKVTQDVSSHYFPNDNKTEATRLGSYLESQVLVWSFLLGNNPSWGCSLFLCKSFSTRPLQCLNLPQPESGHSRVAQSPTSRVANFRSNTYSSPHQSSYVPFLQHLNVICRDNDSSASSPVKMRISK